MLRIGVIRTGLLGNSSPLSIDLSKRLLSSSNRVLPTVATWPISHVRSAPTYEGVDCAAPRKNGRRVGLVGTIGCTTSITESRVLQASTFTEVKVKDTSGRRLQWSHYLAHPGTIELGSAIDGEEFIDSFLTISQKPKRSDVIDLEGIVERNFSDVQSRNDILDLRPPIRRSRSYMRWAYIDTNVEGADTQIITDYRIVSEDVRALTIRTINAPAELATQLSSEALQFCEDLAYHEWLLRSVRPVVEHIISNPANATATMDKEVQPLSQHILHLWMPMARVSQCWIQAWGELDSTISITRQWSRLVETIERYVTISTFHQIEKLRQEIRESTHDNQ